VKGRAWRDYGRYGTVGIELIVTMALGYYGGRYLDARVRGHGWVTFIGFGLGVIVGFRAIFAAGRHMQRDIERAEKEDREENPWQDERARHGTPDDDGKLEP
jgi:putative Mn2+ efflux pump MntP